MQEVDRCKTTYVHKMVRTKDVILCNVCGSTEVDDEWNVTTGPRCTMCITLPSQRNIGNNIDTADKKLNK